MENKLQHNYYQLAEVQLSYSCTIPANQRKSITGSSSAFIIFKDNWNEGTIELYEEFKILLLNRANEVLGISNISKGGVSGTVVDAKLIFTTALKSNATSIIIAHNHPSGNQKPSKADIDITEKLMSAALFLDLAVLDHLIITKEGYYSFADNGKMTF